jgi:hypothetical protein
MIKAVTGISALTREADGEPVRAGSQVVDVGWLARPRREPALPRASPGSDGLGSRPVSVSLFDLGLSYNAGFGALRSLGGMSSPR